MKNIVCTIFIIFFSVTTSLSIFSKDNTDIDIHTVTVNVSKGNFKKTIKLLATDKELNDKNSLTFIVYSPLDSNLVSNWTLAKDFIKASNLQFENVSLLELNSELSYDKTNSKVKTAAFKTSQFIWNNYKTVSSDNIKVTQVLIQGGLTTVRVIALGESALLSGFGNVVLSSIAFVTKTVNPNNWNEFVSQQKSKFYDSQVFKSSERYLNSLQKKKVIPKLKFEWYMNYLFLFSRLTTLTLFYQVTTGNFGSHFLTDMIVIGLSSVPMNFAEDKVRTFVNSFKKSNNGPYSDSLVDFARNISIVSIYNALWFLNFNQYLTLAESYLLLSSSSLFVGFSLSQIMSKEAFLKKWIDARELVKQTVQLPLNIENKEAFMCRSLL